MKSITAILLMSLAGWATAQQHSDRNRKCDEHNMTECDNQNCILLKGRIADCCNYKKTYSRLLNDKQYILLNPCEEILLYRHEEKADKWISYSYYFSKDLDSPVLKLTKENLKGIYPDDFEFHKKLDEIFSNDSQLSRFDGLYNTYVVNWLYARVKQ